MRTNRHNRIAIVIAVGMAMTSGQASAITCASPPQVTLEHVNTRLSINTAIQAMQSAIVAKLTTMERALLDAIEVVNKTIQTSTEALISMIEAQTAEQQRFTQDQTASLGAILSNSSDFMYGEIKEGPSGRRVQGTPHPADACEVAVLSAGAASVERSREIWEQGASKTGEKHTRGKRFASNRAYDNWLGQQPLELNRSRSLVAIDGVMSPGDKARARDAVLVLVDNQPPPNVRAEIEGRHADTPEMKAAKMALERRTGRVEVATESLFRLSSARFPDFPVDQETIDLYPLWDWKRALGKDNPDEPGNGKTSALEMMRLRATYDYMDPNIETRLATEYDKALLARLARYMIVSNYMDFERLAMERERHVAFMLEYADKAKRELDPEVSRLVNQVESLDARE